MGVMALGVPAGAEDAYLYMPWAILWHGEEYYERIESYDQTSERGSGVQYSMAFGLNPVDIGTEMDWTIQEYGCSNVADLLDAIMDPGMYLMFMSLWHRAASGQRNLLLGIPDVGRGRLWPYHRRILSVPVAIS